MELYEILVPCQYNDGRPIRTKYHKLWDEKVRKIAGGLTILQPVKGQWIANSGDLYFDRVIPVRVACFPAQIQQIADITAEHYNQLAVMFYRISEQVFIKDYSKKEPKFEIHKSTFTGEYYTVDAKTLRPDLLRYSGLTLSMALSKCKLSEYKFADYLEKDVETLSIIKNLKGDKNEVRTSL